MRIMTRQNQVTIRRLEARDVHAVHQVISGCRREFGLESRVAAILEPADLILFETYRRRRSAYFVAVVGEELVGGAGIGRLAEGDHVTCELQRMYLREDCRGLGIGHALLQQCLGVARQFQFARCYAETISQMTAAIAFYERHGFRHLKFPLGQTGHSHNDCWMLLELQPQPLTVGVGV
jgi:putative acetyltransferase